MARISKYETDRQTEQKGQNHKMRIFWDDGVPLTEISTYFNVLPIQIAKRIGLDVEGINRIMDLTEYDFETVARSL